MVVVVVAGAKVGAGAVDLKSHQKCNREQTPQEQQPQEVQQALQEQQPQDVGYPCVIVILIKKKTQFVYAF